MLSCSLLLVLYHSSVPRVPVSSCLDSSGISRLGHYQYLLPRLRRIGSCVSASVLEIPEILLDTPLKTCEEIAMKANILAEAQHGPGDREKINIMVKIFINIDMVSTQDSR